MQPLSAPVMSMSAALSNAVAASMCIQRLLWPTSCHQSVELYDRSNPNQPLELQQAQRTFRVESTSSQILEHAMLPSAP
jgi:hypothetical protein